ncbi:MAG: hypothetical protein ACOCSE_04955 [Chitinivibrionales bacterium]
MTPADLSIVTLAVILLCIISIILVIRSFRMPESYRENKEGFENLQREETDVSEPASEESGDKQG